MIVPKGFVPAADFTSFVQSLGAFLGHDHIRTAIISGVSSTAAERQNEISQQQSLWAAAYGLSLCFQVALEMDSLSLNFPKMGATITWLRAEDIALFGVFREQGVAGAAEVYPSFLGSSARGVYGDVFGDSSLRHFGVDVWGSAPPKKPASELPRTFLDEFTDRQQHYDALAHRKVNEVRPDASTVSLLQMILDARMTDESQLVSTLDFFTDAVVLDLGLSSIRQRPEITVKLGSANSFEVSGNRQGTRITIPKDQPLRQWIGYYLRILGALSMPRDILDTLSLDRGVLKKQFSRLEPEQKILSLATYYQTQVYHQEAWGYGVHFNVRNQLESWGIALDPLPENESAMEKTWRELGFAVFVERFANFMSPEGIRGRWESYIHKAARAVLGPTHQS